MSVYARYLWHGTSNGGTAVRSASRRDYRTVIALVAVCAVLAAAIHWASARATDIARPSSVATCSVDTVAGASYTVCGFPRESLSFRLVSLDYTGRRVASIARLDSLARARGERVVFATNAGMYEPDSTATGLLVVDGREERALNLSPGPPDPCSTANFFCPPNGVFFVADGTARIVATHDYARLPASSGWTRPHQATQSGPMLVRNGALARAFNPRSTSYKLRSGVGIRADGSVVFALAERVTFWAFAEAFRTRLRCTDALFLDGEVSQIYTGSGTPPAGGRFSAIFAAFAPARPD